MSAVRPIAVASAVVIAVLATGCRRSKPEVTPAQQATQQAASLAGLTTQTLVIAPVQRLRISTEVGWSGPSSRTLLAQLDSALAAELKARDIGRNWVLATALVQSAARNPTYAADPKNLGVEPLRAALPTVGSRLPEPLATQVRTMVALHEARIVLLPVELRVDRVEGGADRALLRLVLADARTTEVRWASDLRLDPANAPGPVFIGAAARRIADLFIQ